MVKAEAVDDNGSKSSNSTRWHTGKKHDEEAAVELVVAEGLEKLTLVEFVADGAGVVSLESTNGD